MLRIAVFFLFLVLGALKYYIKFLGGEGGGGLTKIVYLKLRTYIQEYKSCSSSIASEKR